MRSIPKITLLVIFLVGMLFGSKLLAAPPKLDINHILNNWHSTYKVDISSNELKSNFMEMLMSIPEIRGEDCKNKDIFYGMVEDLLPKSTKRLNALKSCKTWHIDMNYLIGPLYVYDTVIFMLRSATQDQKIVIHLANFGGYVHTGNVLLNEISQSKAYTVASIDGQSYSMASQIACSTNKLILKPFSYLMFHIYRGGLQGNGQEFRTSIAAADRNFGIQLDQCISKGVLTVDQKENILNGTDIYIFPQDIRK